MFLANIFIGVFCWLVMADSKIQMPGVFGGLMRYDEEYTSRFMLNPSAIIGFIIAVVVFVVVLKVFWPVSFVG